jgi:hypothetical protein
MSTRIEHELNVFVLVFVSRKSTMVSESETETETETSTATESQYFAHLDQTPPLLMGPLSTGALCKRGDGQ